jgi:hypothetical protein
MDEDVLAAAVGLNEAEAFLIIVEFHCAPGHRDILSLSTLNPRVTADTKLGSSMFGVGLNVARPTAKAKRPDCPAECRRQ